MPPKLPAQPFATNTRADTPNQRGVHGGIGDKNKRGETGTVVAYFADTYTAAVRTSHGRNLVLPRMRSSPGEISHLEVGSEVLINNDYGPPFIMGVLAHPAGVSSNEPTHNLTDTDNAQRNNAGTQTPGNYRLSSEPKNMLPGDWTQFGPDGNAISVLLGGTNVMRSSALSQFRTHQVDDLTEIVSRNHRHITDMGFTEIRNENGSLNYTFRGATDQLSEAGSGEGRWTIKFDLGAVGDLCNFELCTPQNQTLFKFHVDSDGKCEIFGLSGVSINSGSQNGGVCAEENTGDKVTSTGGSVTSTVEGSVTETIKGSASTSVSGDSETGVGNDLRQQAVRDVGVSAGRNMFVSVLGNVTGENAMVYDIVSGNWVVNLGSPISPNPKSGFDMQTFAGDMKFSSLLGGHFSVTSPLGVLESNTSKAVLSTNGIPDSVVLGGNVLTSHLVKYEELEAHLRMLYTMLDTHVHIENGTSVAAGIPVVGASGIPVVPFTPMLSPSIVLARSITTGVAL